MKLTLILAAAILSVGLHKWLHRPTAYHTPTAVLPEIIAHQQEQLFGHYRNGGIYQQIDVKRK